MCCEKERGEKESERNRDEQGREGENSGGEETSELHISKCSLSHAHDLGGRPSVGNACVKEEKK